MKRTLLNILFFLGVSSLFAQDYNQTIINSKGDSILVGPTNRSAMDLPPFKSWFKSNHDNYLVNDRVVEELKKSMSEYNIKVFFGSWCGDSKRELPRFYKIMEAANFPESQLEVIAVNNEENTYKQSPNGEEKGLNIHRVPTFIFYKNNKEINRIVEYPKSTLERDMFQIITQNKYTPNYRAAIYIHDQIEQKGIESLKEQEKTLVPKMAEYTKGSRELNTLGYVYLRSDQLDKALYIFDLNTKIFPYIPNTFDSLGEAYYHSNQYAQAIKNYAEVLRLAPKNENALLMIDKIKKLDP